MVVVMVVVRVGEPTSGIHKAGIVEGAFPTFFGKFIGTATLTSFMVLLYRVVTYYLYLVLGSVFLPRWVGRVFAKRPAQQ